MGHRYLTSLTSGCVLGASLVSVIACGSADAGRRVVPRDSGAEDAGADAAGGATGTEDAGTEAGSEPDASVDPGDGGTTDGGSPADSGDGADGSAPPPPKQDAGSGPGVLQINLTNAPNGGDVTVEGPDSFNVRVTGPTTLVGLQTGAYFLRAHDVRPPTGRVHKANPARSTVEVPLKGKAVLTVDYGTRGVAVDAKGLPPGLWFTLNGGLVSLPLDAPDGDYNADVIYNLTPGPNDLVQRPTALAFDGKGGLWLADTLSQSIGRIAASETVTGPLGSIALSGQRLYPYALAFDASGNLWVNGQNQDVQNAVKILGFSAAQLGALPAPVTPNSTYTASNVGNTEQMAFDGTGNLWLSYPQVGNVGFFTPTLSTTQSVNFTYLQNQTFNPQIPLNSKLNPSGVVLDASGNLWSANQKSNEVVGYLASDLASSVSSQTPDFHFTLPDAPVNGTWSPARLAMDPCSSQLYVLTVTSAQERIFRYDVSDPTNPVLKAFMTSPDIGIWLGPLGMATNPIPPGMPLSTGSCPVQ